MPSVLRFLIESDINSLWEYESCLIVFMDIPNIYS